MGGGPSELLTSAFSCSDAIGDGWDLAFFLSLFFSKNWRNRSRSRFKREGDFFFLGLEEGLLSTAWRELLARSFDEVIFAGHKR